MTSKVNKLKRGRPLDTSFPKCGLSDTAFSLQLARKGKRLGQAEVARKLGMTVQFLSNIENDRAPLPFKYVDPLVQLLGMSRDRLIANIASDYVARNSA
jgi:DNA-binding XRE family transcriptional regulator